LPAEYHNNEGATLTSSEEVKVGIEVLVEYDWLTVEKEHTGGRPTERIRMNPRIKF
jgi:hypothetical protein